MGIDLDPQARTRVDAELEPGENLLWAGTGRVDRRVFDAVARLMPTPGTLGTMVPILFSIILGFAAAGIFRSLIAGIALGTASLIVLTRRSMMFRGVTDRMTNLLDTPLLYALTDRRALVWTPSPLEDSIAVRSFTPAEMNAFMRIDRPDGTGDLIFHESIGGPGRGLIRHGFYGIAAPATVERLLRQVRERRTPQPPGPDQDSNLEST